MVDNKSKMFHNQSSELKNAENDSIQQEYFSYVMSEN